MAKADNMVQVKILRRYFIREDDPIMEGSVTELPEREAFKIVNAGIAELIIPTESEIEARN